MSKQTAVEWLMDQITYEDNGGRFASYIDIVNLKDFFDQALAMEREQIEEAVREGYDSDRTVKKWKWIGQEYYDETYGKEADNAK